MSILNSNLKEQGKLDNIHLRLCTIGSRKVYDDDNYGIGSWSIFAPNLTIYGFDVDEEACESANNSLAESHINWNEKHFPLAIANRTGETSLYITKEVHCSSLYPPDQAYVKRFKSFDRGLEVDAIVEIETTTLDDFCQTQAISDLEFLKIDVQGADLDVLRGGEQVLQRSTLGVSIEVEFAPIYQGQPLFAEIDQYLRSRGFILFDLTMDDPWCRLPRSIAPLWSANRPGQLLWANALYLRDLLNEAFSEQNKPLQTPDHLLKLACIADAQDFPDYALELLEHLTLQYGDDPRYNFAPNILEVLSQIPELVEQGLENLPIIQHLQARLSEVSG